MYRIKKTNSVSIAVIAVIQLTFFLCSRAHGREAMAGIISNTKEDIAASEQVAGDFASSVGDFFGAIGRTDKVVAQVAKGSGTAALADEQSALSAIKTFIDKLAQTETALKELKERAKSGKQSEAMQRAMGMTWDDYFDGLVDEIGRVRKSLNRFVARDKEVAERHIKDGNIRGLIDDTGPLAADMVVSVTDMVNHWVRNAVASHRAMDVVYKVRD